MAARARQGRVVLLHGQPGAGAGWRRVVSLLDRSLDVVAPDRPGYGRNHRSPGGVVDNVNWLIDVIAGDRGGAPAVVVGHSWAGAPALELAYRRAAAVRGLVLVASVGPGAITRFDHVLARPGFDRLVARVGSVARRQPSRSHTFLVEQQALVTELPVVLDHLAEVVTPSVVVAGTRDRVVPFATAEALSHRLPNARLVPVRNGGHALHHTHPWVVADAIHRVLDDAGSP